MNNEPVGGEITFSAVRGQNWNQLKETEERGAPSSSKEWNFPHELSNVALAVAGSIQAQARRNPEEGKTRGRRRREASQSPQEVTPCSATTVSTFQRAPHHSLQVKLENGHSAIFPRKFLRIIRAHGVFMAHRLLGTEPVPPTSTESGWSQQWAAVTCFTVGLWSSQNGEGLT